MIKIKDNVGRILKDIILPIALFVLCIVGVIGCSVSVVECTDNDSIKNDAISEYYYNYYREKMRGDTNPFTTRLEVVKLKGYENNFVSYVKTSDNITYSLKVDAFKSKYEYLHRRPTEYKIKQDSIDAEEQKIIDSIQKTRR